MSDPTSVREPSVCSSCGEAFGCGAKLDGCWCTKLTLTDEVVVEIAKKFDGCLCPRCLGALASRPAVDNSPAGQIGKNLLPERSAL